jgi:hypothetical protein
MLFLIRYKQPPRPVDEGTLAIQDACGTVTALTVTDHRLVVYLADFPPDAHPQWRLQKTRTRGL